MIELKIKITGKTLLNNKVDDFMKVIRQIQETEENLDTKIEIKNKKEKVNKKPIKQEEIEEDEDIEEEPTIEDDDIEDNVVDEDYEVTDEEDEDDNDEEEDVDDNDEEEDVDDLRKEAKSFFIKLTKKDKSKAEKFLKKYDVDSLSGLDKVFKDDTEKWEKAIKLLKKHVG